MDLKSRHVIKRFLVSAILTAFFLSSVPFSVSAAGWGSLVKDKLCMTVSRTLEGRVFLDKPISEATIRIYDRGGLFLYETNEATGKDGSFSLTCPLPESFKIVVTGGLRGDDPFEHEISRYIEKFDETALYKVNAVTTLVSAYRNGHIDVSLEEAEAVVKRFLSLPESVGLDDVIYSSEWYCYYFSHYLFMKEAKASQGMSSFVNQLVAEMDAGGIRSFYDGDSIGSSFFKDAMNALLQGALSKLGGEGTGWILGLLNQGGDIDSRLAEMKTDLQTILSDLTQIINALTDLAKDINLVANEVETYIEGLTVKDAITAIKTHYGPDDTDDPGDTNTLKYYSYLTSAEDDATTKAEMATFVENVNGAWDIEEQVQAIHDAIVPDLGTDAGLLDLWTQNFLLQGSPDGDTLFDYYKTLEQYFSILLFYQFKGANIVVEALNYESTSGEVQATSGLAEMDGDTLTPAEGYMIEFQSLIQDETDRFFQCVLNLIFSNCNLSFEDMFLPDSAQEILARATFFIIQTLGQDHFGLRTGAIGTQDLVNDVFSMGSGEYGVVASASEDIELSNLPYDSWGNDLKTLTCSDIYKYKHFDLSPYWEDTGTYEIWWSAADGSQTSVGSALVRKYTPNYVQDDENGTISYGYLVAPFRVGGVDAMLDPSVFVQDKYTVNKSGDVEYNYFATHVDVPPSGAFMLTLSGKNNDNEASSSISQEAQFYHPFVFTGTQATTAYLSIGGQITGSTYWYGDNGSGDECSINVKVGIWDVTNNQNVSNDSHGTSSSNAETKNLNEGVDDLLSFTLQPGVSYYVYANVTGSGTVNYCDGVTGYNGFSYTNQLYLPILELTFMNSGS
jgi:hypothetical protein